MNKTTSPMTIKFLQMMLYFLFQSGKQNRKKSYGKVNKANQHTFPSTLDQNKTNTVESFLLVGADVRGLS